jgi:hypothetical protein
MRAPCGNRPSTKTTWHTGASCLFLLLFGGSLMVLADTPSELHPKNVGGCYCRCAESRGHGFCVKMCDSPKYSARPWATRCVKPRLRLPAENRDAGPRYPHPGRAERAAAEPTSTNQDN